MFSSRDRTRDIILTVYQDSRTVFRLNDIAMLLGDSDFQSINRKVNYHVSTGKLGNPRKGVYTKPGYNPEELACVLYSPSYLSLGYVLQKEGVIFQFDPAYTLISYLTRTIVLNESEYILRKIKGEILVNTTGIMRQMNHVNIATAERALLDSLYLNKDTYFDNLNVINRKKVLDILPIYKSNSLEKRVKRVLPDD